MEITWGILSVEILARSNQETGALNQVIKMSVEVVFKQFQRLSFSSNTRV